MKQWLILIALTLPSNAYCDQITADRPGVGSDPEVVPQWTLQPEMGTDSKEIRIGIIKDFEIDRDDSSWGVKYGLVQSDKLKASVKVSYDSSLKTVVEVPTNYTVNSWFNVGTDVIISHYSRTYVTEFGFNPTSRLSVTPTFYYDDKPRASVYVAWIPPAHDNIQLDLGFQDKKIIVGISTAIDFSNLLRKKK